LPATIPAGSLSVITEAANNSRNRAAGSAENVVFSAIPIRSSIDGDVGPWGAADDILSLLRSAARRNACWLSIRGFVSLKYG
jgi:hypothetical protein